SSPRIKTVRLKDSDTKKLEQSIDAMTVKLPPLTHFILPNGSIAAAQLHWARTVCRRVEREVLELASNEPINDRIIVYLNRLSDWLFTAARFQNLADEVKEITWNV